MWAGERHWTMAGALDCLGQFPSRESRSASVQGAANPIALNSARRGSLSYYIKGNTFSTFGLPCLPSLTLLSPLQASKSVSLVLRAAGGCAEGFSTSCSPRRGQRKPCRVHKWSEHGQSTLQLHLLKDLAGPPPVARPLLQAVLPCFWLSAAAPCIRRGRICSFSDATSC